MNRFDVTVIGGGPAGLAAALAAGRAGAKTLLIEREARLGGVLKQCIHDGFGLLRYSEKLSGCEYATRDVRLVEDSGIQVMRLTFATALARTDEGFSMTLIRREGLTRIETRAIVLATGCRERTARQVGIHGDRGAGVFTAGSAQYYINVLGKLPGRRCVILGSGDIGLIMARRLTLEGAQVEGVYEAKPTPSGLTRNIYQCLHDFDIPLHLSHTVTRVHGADRISGVTVAAVDGRMQPIPGTEREVDCDTLILSVGLIPENELAEQLGVTLDPRTKGALSDESHMTGRPGVFACGNALNVFDLVDYVSESGERAGSAAARYALSGSAAEKPGRLLPVEATRDFLCAVPQRIHADAGKVVCYFRSASERGRTRVLLKAGDTLLYAHVYSALRPPEMERVEVDLSALDGGMPDGLQWSMEEVDT